MTVDTDEGVHESTSQQSLSDFKPLVSSTVSSDRVELETQLGDQSQVCVLVDSALSNVILCLIASYFIHRVKLTDSVQ